MKTLVTRTAVIVLGVSALVAGCTTPPPQPGRSLTDARPALSPTRAQEAAEADALRMARALQAQQRAAAKVTQPTSAVAPQPRHPQPRVKAQRKPAAPAPHVKTPASASGHAGPVKPRTHTTRPPSTVAPSRPSSSTADRNTRTRPATQAAPRPPAVAKQTVPAPPRKAAPRPAPKPAKTYPRVSGDGCWLVFADGGRVPAVPAPPSCGFDDPGNFDGPAMKSN